VRIGFLSDVHGNQIALEACLPRLLDFSPDAVYFLGDAVGYMPDAEACLALLEAAGATCQKGNHEAMLLGEKPVPDRADAAYRIGEARDALPPERIEWLTTWPDRRELEIEGRRILLVHGSPDDSLSGYVYPDSDLTRYRSLPYDVIVTANTHRPFATQLDGSILANAGSVGLPRDVGNLAAFCVYDTTANEMAVYRVAFDVERVRERIGGRVDRSVEEVLSRDEPGWFGELLK
jgi:predicted phosphodiesterase